MAGYYVKNLGDINRIIIPHFNKYPLLTCKKIDYELWKDCIEIVNRKEHLTNSGLLKIISIKTSMNTGLLSENIKASFPDVIEMARPVYLHKVGDIKFYPSWVAGFTEGFASLGSFTVDINKIPKSKIGYTVVLRLQITQHSRDEVLIKSLINYFNCGNTIQDKRESVSAITYRVSKINDILEKIIPFYLKYPMVGYKALDFSNFCKVAELVKNKAHLTEDGLQKIKGIKAQMGKSRLALLPNGLTSKGKNFTPVINIGAPACVNNGKGCETHPQRRSLHTTPIRTTQLSATNTGDSVYAHELAKAQIRCSPFNKKVRYYSSSGARAKSLNPNFVTGLIDAEGCFIISVRQDSKNKSKWVVQASLEIRMSSKDLSLLVQVQRAFKDIGYFSHKAKTNTVSYTITKLGDLVDIVIPHFNIYPLRSAKSIDYKLWTQCVEIMSNKQHITDSGLKEILSLKSVLNWGLTEKIRTHFPNIKCLDRPVFEVSNIPLDPYWVSGFSEGDSSFYVHIAEPKIARAIYKVELHEREVPLLHKLQEFFGGAGKVNVSSSSRSLARYTITRTSDLVHKVLPHFSKFELAGSKHANYIIWSQILKLIDSKAHLTLEGLDQIKVLKLSMFNDSEGSVIEEANLLEDSRNKQGSN